MKKYSFSILILALLMAACTRTDDAPDGCKYVEVESGIIQNEVEVLNCIIEKMEDNYVIKDSVAYASFQAEVKSSSISCDNAEFPEIDFSESTLLGLWADGGGCSINYYRSVGKLVDSKEYLYTVTVQECGFCEMYGFSYNWVLVPKLPADYSVRFQVKSLN